MLEFLYSRLWVQHITNFSITFLIVGPWYFVAAPLCYLHWCFSCQLVFQLVLRIFIPKTTDMANVSVLLWEVVLRKFSDQNSFLGRTRHGSSVGRVRTDDSRMPKHKASNSSRVITQPRGKGLAPKASNRDDASHPRFSAT